MVRLINKVLNKVKITALSFLNMIFPSKNHKRIFEKIYEKELWSDKDKAIPLSGPGSSTKNTTKIKALLEKFILDNKIKSIADLGCGDLTWMSDTNFFNDQGIDYIGIDVVGTLIDKHRKVYANKTFYNIDITTDEVPEAELFIIRDVTFHLHLDCIAKLFENIKGKWSYLAITSSLNTRNNNLFDQRHFSERNLTIHPFNIKSNYLASVSEDKFNRIFFIIAHDAFYEQ